MVVTQCAIAFFSQQCNEADNVRKAKSSVSVEEFKRYLELVIVLNILWCYIIFSSVYTLYLSCAHMMYYEILYHVNYLSVEDECNYLSLPNNYALAWSATG